MKITCLYTGKYAPVILSATLILGLLLAPGFSPDARAASAEEIDVSVELALDRFKNEVRGASEFLENAKGILVIPNVIRVGFVIGGEYGEGALIVDGKTVDYYSTTAGSLGLQIGAQSKNIVIVFMEDDALMEFRNSLGWRAGVDGSAVFIDYGAGTSVDSDNVQHPIVGFVFGLKGLMANLSLEGAKFTKLSK
ncbi:YSC84-related protein [Thermodesulfobacteriota bacterium]